jgi:tRNA-Thr(GGU) m(6)t(6)A37 methyltransferase TsaA
MFEKREGEELLDIDPSAMPKDAGLVFIGKVSSPWTQRENCPKNMRAARETGRNAKVLVAPSYRPGLRGLERTSHVIVLTWLHHSPRNLIVQKPRHADESKGVFALRSPARPNPVGVHVVKLLGMDMESGELQLEAIDVLDGTPVIDLKPYFASVDSMPEAHMSRSDG